MTKLTFLNKELDLLKDFLIDMKLKGKTNRHRMRIVKELDVLVERFQSELRDIAKEHALKDENGEPVLIKKLVNNQEIETFDFEDEQSFFKEVQELENEEAIFDHEKHKEELKTILQALDESEKELSGQDAIIESLIYDRIENVL